LPGRGAYVCLSDECLELAVKRHQFQRAFKNQTLQVSVGQLKGDLLLAIEQKMVNLLGMARKSGVLISGSSMVLDGLTSRSLALVVLAGDVSEGIGSKVAGSAAAKDVPCCRLLDKESLGKMLGKEERSRNVTI
jgi:ribosomal protein L7Ae-like RNA K-turn-binding protein